MMDRGQAQQPFAARAFGKTSGYCRRSVDFCGNHARRRLSAILADVFSATTGDRSRATRARSHPDNPVLCGLARRRLRSLVLIQLVALTRFA
jgi:hypothetical protein